MQGEECLAMVSAFRKTYLIGGRREPCLETCDWFCRPDVATPGLGSTVMRALTESGERIISLGGTREAQDLLPLLGWRTPVVARSYDLPLSGRLLATVAARRIGIPAALSRIPLAGLVHLWFRPRPRGGMENGSVTVLPSLEDGVPELYREETGYGVVQLPHMEFLRWMTAGYPGSGRYSFLHFLEGERLRGWALTRLVRTRRGLEGALVDLYAPRPDPATYEWMVRSAAAALAAHRPDRVTALATCPILQLALQRNHFLERGSVPVRWWWPGPEQDLAPLHITLNCGDDGIVPYPKGEDADSHGERRSS
jgi:hypothetical protein